MPSRRLRLLLPLCALALSCGDPTAEVKDPIRVGLLTTVSGDLANSGREFTDATNLAFDEINRAGGILGGRQLTLDTLDEAGAGGAAIGYSTLLNRGVPVILGPTLSSSVVALKDQIVAGGTLTLSQSATSQDISALPKGGVFFRLPPSDTQQGRELAKLIVQAGITQLCAVKRGDSWGSGLYATMVQTFAGQVAVTPASYDPTQQDLSHVVDPCDPLLSVPGSAIVFISYVGDGAALIDSAALRGWKPANGKKLFFADGAKDPGLLKLLADPSVVEGAIGTGASGPDPLTADGTYLRDFQTRFIARYNRTPFNYAEHAYDAAYLAAMAMEVAGTATDRKAIAEVIHSGKLQRGERIPSGNWAGLKEILSRDGELDYDGASGSVNFDLDTGDVLAPYYMSIWTFNSGAVVVQRVERLE